MTTRTSQRNKHVGPLLAGGTTILGLLASGLAHASNLSPNLAYIDPGAGSFLLQAVVATLAGAVVAISTYWTKVKQFLGLAPKDPSKKSDHEFPSEGGD